MAVSSAVRRRLEAQGFCDLDEATLNEVGPWLRWSPAFCTLFMAAGVALKSPMVLWALALTAFLGALLPLHPFDLLYNYGARYLTGTRPLPHQGPQRRFACGVATVWLLATGWAFYVDAPLIGYLLGVPLILVAALVSLAPHWIPALIYGFFVRACGRARS